MPRSSSDFQPTEDLFRTLTVSGNLIRVWRLISQTQQWRFYDPEPDFAPFNNLTKVNVGSDPPIILAVNINDVQRFRGTPLHSGWNLVPITNMSLAPKTGGGVESMEDLFRPLIENGTLGRVWWLDSATQEWKFFDPNPELASFNTLQTIDLAARPPIVLSVNVTRAQRFRGIQLYLGRNYVIMR